MFAAVLSAAISATLLLLAHRPLGASAASLHLRSLHLRTVAENSSFVAANATDMYTTNMYTTDTPTTDPTYYAAAWVPCTQVGQTTAECNYNGFCTESGHCRCNDGYTTHRSSTECNYRQKSRYTAFLLQFFIGGMTGAGEFYLGNIGLASGQLALFWGSIPLQIITGVFESVYLVEGSGWSTLTFVLCSFAAFFWWLVDWIMILTGDRKDGNGVDTFHGF